jgi:flagellar FliL protein
MSVEEKKEGEEGAVAKPKSKKKLFIIIGVVVLILAAGVPILFLGGGEEVKDEHAAAEEEEVKHYTTVALDPIIVNLSANTAFLKVSMILEYDAAILDKAALESAGHGEGGGHGGGASGGGGEAEGGGMHPLMTARQPMIKDVILRILSSKKPEEVLTAEGKEKLKEELIEGINEAIGLEEEPVVNIYFTEFMVQ